MGPLRNVSFEVGMDANTENNFLAPAKRDVVAGLQFAFDLPYKGYVNVAPLVYWEFSNHNSFTQCGRFGPGIPGIDLQLATATSRTGRHGRSRSTTTWISASCRRTCSTSRSAAAPAGTDRRATRTAFPRFRVPDRFSTASKTEFNSEPIRLTFDASKAFMGPKYSHFVDLWVAYRYWQNKFGLDHNAMPGVCTLAANGQSTNSCTESTVYGGVTVKF